MTARGCLNGCHYGGYTWVAGYVRNLSTTPLLSVTLEVDMTVHPFCLPLPGAPACGPYPATVQVKPALPATLPGQINPFFHKALLAKMQVDMGAMRSIIP